MPSYITDLKEIKKLIRSGKGKFQIKPTKFSDERIDKSMQLEKPKIYQRIFSREFENFFRLAKNYKNAGRQRESLLYSRLCLEHILRCMYVIHVKKRNISYNKLIKELGGGRLKELADRSDKPNSVKKNLCILCNVLSISDLKKILDSIKKLGTRAEGTEEIKKFVNFIDELVNKGVHTNIDYNTLTISNINSPAENVFTFLSTLTKKLKELE